MQITFGMFMDGAEWSSKSASLDEITCGPNGLLVLLEGRLGLDGIHPTAAERISQYQQKISIVNPKWCQASFELDPWSTTKQLLTWRDELVLAGWDGKFGSSERLKALASIEACNSPLSPSEGDRLKNVLVALDSITFQNIAMDLCTLREHMPFLWRKTIEKLELCGAKIKDCPSSYDITAKCLCVKAPDEMTLAKDLARYLFAGDNSDVAVIADSDTHLLDGILHQFGFGAIGHQDASKWRDSLQILPLWLEILWKPFNPRIFLELLMLPISPIRPMVAKALADVMRQTPGIGSEEWNKAWKQIDEYIIKNEKRFYSDTAEEIAKIHELRHFLEEKCFRTEGNVSGTDIITRCDRMIENLRAKAQEDSGIATAISHATTLKQLIDSSANYDHITLSRILETVIGTGTKGDDQSEANGFTVYVHPGAVNKSFKTILWWNFTDHEQSAGTYWTQDEKTSVLGLDLSATERNTQAWKRALSFAQERVITFFPEKNLGEPAFIHPLADEILFDMLPSSTFINETGRWRLADRTLQLQEMTKTIKPPDNKISANDIAPRRALSYSQMSKLLTCPFKWFMDDYIGLKQTSILDMPNNWIMIGTLAHKVVELLYKGNEHLETNEATERASKLFDQLVPQMAAELLQDGKTVELKRTRDTLCRAIKSLVTVINNQGLKVKGMEKEVGGTFKGMAFTGKIDLYLEDDAGKPFVIDMKWSSNNKYKNMLEKDSALQLATYAWQLRPDDCDVQCAYYLFPKQEFNYITDSNWQYIWEKANRLWEERMKNMHKGILEYGNPKEKDAMLKSECEYCIYAAICGREDENEKD